MPQGPQRGCDPHRGQGQAAAIGVLGVAGTPERGRGCSGVLDAGAVRRRRLPSLLCAAGMLLLLVRAGSSRASKPPCGAPVLRDRERFVLRASLIRGSQSAQQRVGKCWCCPGFVAGETETGAVKGKTTGRQAEVPGASAGFSPPNAPRLLPPSGQSSLLNGACAVVRGRAAAPSCCRELRFGVPRRGWSCPRGCARRAPEPGPR